MPEEVKEKIADKLRRAFSEEETEAYRSICGMIERGGVFASEKLMRRREDLGKSKDRLGKELGVTGGAVSFWEAGKYRPTPEYVVKLAGILGCRAEEFYTMPGEPEEQDVIEIGGCGEYAFPERVEVPAAELVYGTDSVPGALRPEELQEIRDAAEAASDAAAAFTETGDAAAETSDAVFAFIEEADSERPDYLRNIIALLERQRQKGIDKNGQKLEDNLVLSPMERFEYMKEEMADMLFYTEHLQRMYRESGMGADDYQRRVVETSGMNESELLIRGVLMLSGAAGELAGSMDGMLFSAGAEADREAMAGRLSQIARGLAFAAEGIGMTLSEVMGNG